MQPTEPSSVDHSQDALRESEARLRAIVETAVDGIITIDERGLITTFNPAAVKMFGYQPQEVLGKNVNVLMPAPYHAEHDGYLKNHRETGVKKIIGIGREVTGRRKDGQEFPMDLAVSETRLGERRIFTGIIRDISERRAAEKALATQAAELAKSNAELEEANRTKDDFLAVLSHELRTPLTPVLAMASHLVAHGEFDVEVREDLEMICRNVQMEARLIDDLLDMTRIVRKKLSLHFEVVNAHEVAMAALGMFTGEIGQKNLEVTVNLAAQRHFVWADRSRLQQVFAVLLSNAAKFTPDNGRITVESRNNDAGSLVLEVADTGIGIDPAFIPRMFNRFEQGEQTVTRRYGGLGIGLSIAKSLIEMHQGSIHASSPGPNLGAVLGVELETVAILEAHPQQRAEPRQEKECRILLVEDHYETRRIMARLLKSFGCIVATAGSVKEAIELGDRESFDLLVSDIGLPDGSGIDIMKVFKSRHQTRGIAVSGFGQDEDLRKSLEAGFETHLTKPIDFQTLQSVIKRMAG